MKKPRLDKLMFWRFRFILILVVSVIAGCFATFYFLTIQGAFVSTGVLLFDGDVPAYRRLAVDSFDNQTLAAWIASKDSKADQRLDRLRAALPSRAAFETHFQPFLRVTKTDIRDLVSFKDEASNQVEGVVITFHATGADEAASLVQLGAQYLRDATLRNALFLWLQLEGNKASIEIERSDEIFRTNTFELGLLNTKLARLKQITPAATDRSSEAPRDILSITDTTAKYLPLTVQQVGVESELIEVRRDLSNAERTLALNQYVLQFVSRAFSSLASQQTGGGSLAALNAMFATDRKDGKTPEPNDAAERLRLQLDLFREKYVARPLLARDIPQVSDRRGHAWFIGSFTAIGMGLLLLAFAVLPRLVRWVLVPEENRE